MDERKPIRSLLTGMVLGLTMPQEATGGVWDDRVKPSRRYSSISKAEHKARTRLRKQKERQRQK